MPGQARQLSNVIQAGDVVVHTQLYVDVLHNE